MPKGLDQMTSSDDHIEGIRQKGQTIAFRKVLNDPTGMRIAVLSLCLYVFLAAAKYLLHRVTHSAALLAEAVHSLTDVIGSLLVVAGIALAKKKSKRFPWGLYKTENLAALFLAGMIFLSAYEIATMIVRPPSSEMRNLDASIATLVLLALPVWLFARFERARGIVVNCPSLLADAAHWKADIAPLAVVAAGLVAARFSYFVMDRIAASLVLILVVRAGYGILKNSLKSLLDASVDNETLGRVQEVVRSFPQVKELVSLQARNSGRFIFVEISAKLSLTRLKEAHEIALALEREIKGRIPFVERVIVHYEPEKKELLRYAAPLAGQEGVISEHFAKAPLIAIWDERISDGAVVSQKILVNPFSQLEKGKGIKLAEFLVTMKVDVLYTKELFEGKGPEYVFSDAGVEIRKTSAQKLKNLTEHDPGEMHFMEALS
jgi:cation diffusion facilitator family transporter